MPLCHASMATSFITDTAAKILKKCNIFLLIMNSPEGGGLLLHATHFLKALIELMSSSN